MRAHYLIQIIIKGLSRMYSLYLSDLIEKKSWNPKRVKLIRHTMSQERFKIASDYDVVREYTQMQKEGFFKDTDYVLAFAGVRGQQQNL